MLSKRSLLIALLVALVASVHSFVPPTTRITKQLATTPATTSSRHSTQLAERRWNFNEGRAPWGLKKNAEIWNGRVAQVRNKDLCSR